MLERLPDPEAAGVRGWIVEPSAANLKVTFFGLDGAMPYGIFESTVTEGRIVSNLTNRAREPLSQLAQRMVRARQIAIARPFERCNAGAPNPVVLPPEREGGPVPVYILTPQIKTGAYPFGRHRETDIGPDGRVVFEREFTRTCIDLSATDPLPNGATRNSVFITHLLDPVPTELHVYLSLWMKLPIYVATPKGIFAVDGATIRVVDKSFPTTAPR